MENGKKDVYLQNHSFTSAFRLLIWIWQRECWKLASDFLPVFATHTVIIHLLNTYKVEWRKLTMPIAHLSDLCIYHWLFVLIIIPTESNSNVLLPTYKHVPIITQLGRRLTIDYSPDQRHPLEASLSNLVVGGGGDFPTWPKYFRW